MDPLASEVLLHSSVGDDLSSNLLLKTPSGSTTAFCPVNINNRHWILLALCSLMKSIKVYDPQGNEHPSVIRKYKIFLGDSAWQVSYPELMRFKRTPSVELFRLWCVCLSLRQLPHEQQDFRFHPI